MALILWYFLIGFVVVSIFLDIYSIRLSLILIWCSFLLIPIILLSSGVFKGFNVINICTVFVLFFSSLNEISRKAFKLLLRKYSNFLVVYVGISFLLFVFSETVPLKEQLIRYCRELLTLVFVLYSFSFAQFDTKFVKQLSICFVIVLVLNFIYSIYFEIYLGYNPAGMPLLIMMGLDENAGATDMIESARGIMSFRLQSTFGHPLTLGQFFLMLTPMVISMKELNKHFRFILIILLTLGILLSGTRGAIIPLFVIFLIVFTKNGFNNIFSSLLALFPLLLIFYVLIPNNYRSAVNEFYENYSSMVYFWDESKQFDNNISGSSLSMRVEQFDAAIEEISPNPLFGRGLGYREYWQSTHAQSAHPTLLGYESFILLKLVEQGWLGLLFYLWVLFKLYKLFSRGCSQKMYLRCLYFGIFLSQLMTGIRPFSLIILGMASLVISFSGNNNNRYLSK